MNKTNDFYAFNKNDELLDSTLFKYIYMHEYNKKEEDLLSGWFNIICFFFILFLFQ